MHHSIPAAAHDLQLPCPVCPLPFLLWSLCHCSVHFAFQNRDRKHRTYVYVLIVTEVLEDWEDSVNIGKFDCLRKRKMVAKQLALRPGRGHFSHAAAACTAVLCLIPAPGTEHEKLSFLKLEENVCGQRGLIILYFLFEIFAFKSDS